MTFVFRNQTSGSIAANATGVELDVRFHSATKAAFQVTGTFTGTLTPQVSLDGSTWHNLAVFTPAAPTTPVTTMTAAGAWFASLPIPLKFRVQATAWTSGTANVLIAVLPE